MSVNWDGLYKLWTEFEGEKLVAYPDPATGAEPWTIGRGHTGSLSGSKVRKGDRITKAQSKQFMIDDLNAVHALVKKLVKVELNENQWAALLSFAGNLKWNSFVKSSVLRYINQGRLDEVPGRMALYRLGDGKVMKGLVRRRAAEGVLWMTPVSTMDTSAREAVDVDKAEASGVAAEPAKTKKPWDWGAIGAMGTLISTTSKDFKEAVGNVTETFGIDPIVLLVAVGIGFGAWTIYSKWKER